MTTVTISGADDVVPIDRMVELSERFPFLEWGILLSESRAGTDRYPSAEWVRALKRQPIALSAHLCGAVSKVAASGMVTVAFFAHPEFQFQRIQVNGYAVGGAVKLPNPMHTDFEYVLQAHDELMVVACALDIEKARARSDTRFSILFDPSGGRGRDWSGRWPRAMPRVRMGYAGGIGPTTSRRRSLRSAR